MHMISYRILALHERTEEHICAENVPICQEMCEPSAVMEDVHHVPVSKTMHWSAPDYGALFDMDLEYHPRDDKLDYHCNESVFESPLEDASIQEDAQFSSKRLECGDQEGDQIWKLGKTVHPQKHYALLLDTHPPLQNNPCYSGTHSRDALQTWQILEQHFTKSKSISVPKTRRKSTAF
jgi:hypothetical protein